MNYTLRSFSKFGFVLVCIGFFNLILGFKGIQRLKPEPIHEIEIPLEFSTDSVKMELTLRDSVEEVGRKLLGIPYVYGGSSTRGFDCSGFVSYVFGQLDVKVPRTSTQFGSFGREVSIDSVRKGDVLIFRSPSRDAIGHVGIVTEAKGMESVFIHASSGAARKVVLSSLAQEGYRKRFIKAVNVL
jgi:cell wall-associated NlpC family hydrolase